MTALLASRGEYARATLSAILEDGLRWATFAATYGVICATMLALLYLVGHAGAAIER